MFIVQFADADQNVFYFGPFKTVEDAGAFVETERAAWIAHNGQKSWDDGDLSLTVSALSLTVSALQPTGIEA